jgi:hypothetical protein
MSKFNVGDLVKFISVNNFRLYGEIGMIKHIYFSGECAVCFNRDFDFYSCKESELKLVDCSKELVEPAKEEFYKKDDLILDKYNNVRKIADVLIYEDENECVRKYYFNNDADSFLLSREIIGKLVPLKETDEVKEGEKVWCIDNNNQVNLIPYRKYTIIGTIIMGELTYIKIRGNSGQIQENNILRFARLVKPNKNNDCIIVDECDEISKEAMDKFSNLLKDTPLFKPIFISTGWCDDNNFNNFLKNKEESKMDIKEVSKDNIKEAMKIAEQEKKTEAIEFAKGEYYKYLNTLDGYEAQIRIARENIILTEKAIKELKSAHPEFSKKVK